MTSWPVEPIVRWDGWVIGGAYQRKLGELVTGAADVVLWLICRSCLAATPDPTDAATHTWPRAL